MGDRAGVVEEILAVGKIVTRRIGVVGEQDEAGLTIIERRADHHQRFGRHVVPCGFHSFGKQPKGMDSVDQSYPTSNPGAATRIPCACSTRTGLPPQPCRIAHSRSGRGSYRPRFS